MVNTTFHGRECTLSQIIPSAGVDSPFTATGGSTTTLNDTGRNFTRLGIQAGDAIVTTGGTGSGQTLAILQVVSATQLRFATATAPDATTTYYIISTFGVAENIEWTVESELEEVPAIGQVTPADLKEGVQSIDWTIKKALINAQFFKRIERDSVGYSREFEVVCRMFDKSPDTSLSSVREVSIEFKGCKASTWTGSIPAKGGIAVETIKGKAKTFNRDLFNIPSNTTTYGGDGS